MKCLLILMAGVSVAYAGTMAEPMVLKAEALKEFAELSKERKKVISDALEMARKNQGFRYKFGGASPKAGGFDCSGAMYYLLRKSELKPPRTSSQQYVWVRDAKELTTVPRSVKKVDDAVFEKMLPGDLLFWSGTYAPTDGRTVKITHVGMYLGTEKKDGRPVMICATRGRSYRGVQRDGFGVYDFRIPSSKSRSKFEGYGPPPGLDKKGGETE
ncbi:MAG: C40 family peptidase [Verrucomicrobiaceae bacterium]